MRDSEQYVESLRDGREVWISGEKVEDVTLHSAFRNSIKEVAHIYDAKFQPKLRDVLTYQDDSGKVKNTIWMKPKTTQDLIKKRRTAQIIAEKTYGVFGRTPDVTAAFLLGLLNVKEVLAKGGKRYAKNIETYYNYCAENDLFLTHAFVDPQFGKAKGSMWENDPDAHLRIVEETDEGVVLKGAKGVATLAPNCNEAYILPLPRDVGQRDEFALGFAVPLNAKGLKLLCREGLSIGRSRFDSPLSSKFDEVDALLVFEDVLIPWDRIFIKGSAVGVNLITPTVFGFARLNSLVRMLVKGEMFLGVASLLTEYSGVSQYSGVQETISEIIVYIETLRAFIYASENNPVNTSSGLVMPNPTFIAAGRLYAVQNYPRLHTLIAEIGGSGPLMAPPNIDFENEEISQYLHRFYKGETVSAIDRAKLMRLAWDMVDNSFAGRQMLFELHNGGHIYALKRELASSYDRSRSIARAKKAAAVS